MEYVNIIMIVKKGSEALYVYRDFTIIHDVFQI